MAQRFDVSKVSPDGYKAFGPLYQYIASSGLEKTLIDLVFLRVSQINGCAYCVDLHWRDLLKEGEDPRKINSLVTWHESPFFSERERAALAWTESLTNVSATHVPDADYDVVKARFSEKEIGDLTLVISLMNAMNRVGISSRLAPPLHVA
ncbi:carboxymuconolactone decarboxylase family protein [Pseudorhodoplanes sinuspersici]|uniref:Alkylhydroperoxidase n=1 Tax=Pseudorhodoplanes sinuspersici TaxID=1235591 RepID=A0A1W6ZV41_9HYPH|nr:carboxymuconolactone decarboxylase family protein [Pseudorhodoplanes sinuspersici]ARQ01212.1 alkylhydroperoxidase [Pseudorhodoplanes sinuspersici]RKE72876.1 AhpD family alkylhydroperoxidase [Pseudorhodoplanes sinuspersici]